MFCAQCGNRLDGATVFCPKCGASVQTTSVVEKASNGIIEADPANKCSVEKGCVIGACGSLLASIVLTVGVSILLCYYGSWLIFFAGGVICEQVEYWHYDQFLKCDPDNKRTIYGHAVIIGISSLPLLFSDFYCWIPGFVMSSCLIAANSLEKHNVDPSATNVAKLLFRLLTGYLVVFLVGCILLRCA